jgi:hypothetical protein
MKEINMKKRERGREISNGTLKGKKKTGKS